MWVLPLFRGPGSVEALGARPTEPGLSFPQRSSCGLEGGLPARTRMWAQSTALVQRPLSRGSRVGCERGVLCIFTISWIT